MAGFSGDQLYLMEKPLPRGSQSGAERPALFHPDCKSHMIIATAAEIV